MGWFGARLTVAMLAVVASVVGMVMLWLIWTGRTDGGWMATVALHALALAAAVAPWPALLAVLRRGDGRDSGSDQDPMTSLRSRKWRVSVYENDRNLKLRLSGKKKGKKRLFESRNLRS